MPTIDLIGEFEHRLDERGRLALPSAYRGLFEYGGYLLPGPDGQIELYTPEGYDEMKRQRTANSSLHQSSRQLRRGFFGRIHRVELDRQGRILIPAHLRSLRQLEGTVSIVGMGDYLEIWQAEAWETEQSEIDEAYARLLEELTEAMNSTAASREPEAVS